MFDLYSERARRVIFFARLESGARGAEMIDFDDLLAGFVVEDQNKISDALAMLGQSGPAISLATHEPILPPDSATRLLGEIRQSVPRWASIPASTDMPISPILGEILAAASVLREKLQSAEVTPLHLLAVMLARSSERIQALRDAGITEEKIIETIRREGRS